MREKTRKLILSIFLAACIVALMAASLSYTLTNGRYTGGKLSEDSPYDDIIDFVGATKYTVSTPEELVNAIENGYSYIEIDKNAPDPFVINSDIADVASNLVLNVNGHIVVRNSRNPLINVQKNVSVVLVYDSESIDESTPEEDMGGFYNPVGSALQASGGTLTVGAGIYESGPDADNQTKTYTTGTEVTLFSRGDDRTAAYPEAGTSATDLPILQGKAVGTDEFVYDYYFQEKPSDVNALIEADTYLIYTEEKNAYIPTEGENAGKLIVNAEEVTGEEGTTTTVSGDEFFVPCNVASCDFYYYYPVADTESTVGSGDQTQTVQTYAVVYGYHDVKGLASNKDNAAETLQEKGLVWPYAAIRSEAGSAYARGGEFHTYFGTVNTYGIYSSGGIMTVGGEASVAPVFSARGQGTCIYMAADESGDETDNILTIDSGTFSSEIGDTIKMFGGKMNVKAGTFTKDATAAPSGSTNNGSAISISGGKLSINGSESESVKSVSFNINGSHVNGVKMEKTENNQTDIIKNAAFSFNHGHGGNSVAAIQVIGGKLEVSSSTFNFNQDHSGQSSANNGIYVQGGSVTATGCTFSLNPNGSVTRSAAIASVGGSVTATGSEFSVKGNSNYGVYSSGGTITATDCTITMTGTGSGLNDNFGIYSTLQEGSKGGTATANGCTITIDGTYSAGVLSMGGTLNVGASDTKATSIMVEFTGNSLSSAGVSSEGGKINLTGNTTITSDGLGITARGEINVDSGTTTVTTKRGTGIYVQNGTLTVADVATVEVDSKIDDDCSWVVPPEHEGEPLNTNKYNGVFINGGSLKAEGTLNVEFTGVANTTTDYDYTNFETRSYAVRVEGGKGTSVLINKGTITNDKGGGLYVNSSDSWSIGEQNIKDLTFEGISAQDATKVELKAVDISTTGTGTVSTENIQSNWDYNLYTEGGPAVKVNQGVLRIADGTYTAKSGDGIRVQGGVAFVEGGYFVGRDYTGNSDAYLPGAGASYAFKVFGGHAKVTGGVFGRISENETTGQGNGAFVMGGTAYITKADIQAGGTTAFSVWTNANVTFNGTNEDIQVIGDSTGLAIETGGTNPALSVTINGGTFKGTDKSNTNTNGIWYGNSNAQLTITNGYFEGARRSGLRMDVEPSWDWDNVQLSGGTFLTTQGSGYNAISADRDFGYSRILETGARAYSGGNDLSNRNVNDGNGRYTNITIG